MRQVRSKLVIALLAAVALSTRAAAVRGQEFNEIRLQQGQAAYQQKRYLEAIDQFRIAAFGLLDRPSMLCAALVRLALAQAAAERTADADATLNRFLEVERRFSVYAGAPLPPEIRSEFQELLTRRIPAATLQTVPSLSGKKSASGGS